MAFFLPGIPANFFRSNGSSYIFEFTPICQAKNRGNPRYRSCYGGSMRVRITSARAYAHGHIETLLIQMGVTPPSPRSKDGTVEVELSEQQLATFQLRGSAHKVERRLPDAATSPAPPPPAPVPQAAPAIEVPTVGELVASGKTKKQALPPQAE